MENSFVGLIPASRMPAVEDAFVRTFGSSPIDAVQMLSGGLSGSAVYKVAVGGKSYVLKLDTPSANGKPAMSHASEAGIAPRLSFVEASTGISIIEFVEGVPIRGALAPEKLVDELAATILAIHSIPHHIPGRSMLESFEGIKRSFVGAGILKGALIDECFDRFELVREKYPWHDTDTVFSHNDINPGNLLWDGTRFRVIDWDQAFSNDRYFDLATAANFFVQTPALEGNYLHVYFRGAVDDYKRARFFVMRQISRIIYSMLLTQVAFLNVPAGQILDPNMEGQTLAAFGELIGAGKLSMTSHEGQLMYGKAQMNEAVRQMRTPRFVEALERL